MDRVKQNLEGVMQRIDSGAITDNAVINLAHHCKMLLDEIARLNAVIRMKEELWEAEARDILKDHYVPLPGK